MIFDLSDFLGVPIVIAAKVRCSEAAAVETRSAPLQIGLGETLAIANTPPRPLDVFL